MKIFRRHSPICPCREDIKSQSQYYHKMLQKLGQGSPKKREKILSKCDACFIRYLGRCAKGILCSTIKLPKKKYKDLKGSGKFLLKLVNPKISLSRKREALKTQSGSGFFPLLAGIASTAIGNLIGRMIT